MPINKIIYGGNTLIDLTSDTVTPATLLKGVTAHGADGSIITGTYEESGAGSGIVVTEEPDEHGGTIKRITAVDLSSDTVKAQYLLSGYTAHDNNGNAIVGTYSGGGSAPVLQSKSVTPTTSSQNVTADSGYDGLSSVNVAAIPSQYIVPSGTLTVTTNGTKDVTSYASVEVNVPTGGGDPVLQSKTATPTESEQTIVADTNYDGLSQVVVAGISSTYVGSGVTRKAAAVITPTENTQTIASGQYLTGDQTISAIPSTYVGTGVTRPADLTVDGASVTAPAGYYSSAITKSVASATQATPSISVSAAGVITASATQTAGYVAAGTKSATQTLTTQAATTITPTKTSQQAVASGVYTTGAVTVAAIPAEYITTTDATATAADIISGETAYVNGTKVTGTLVVQTIYTGTSAPDASSGVNGDVYIQTGA